MHTQLRVSVIAAAVAFGAAVAVLATGPPAARALESNVRDGWVAGVALGTGSGKVTFGSGDAGTRVESGWQRGVVPQYRLGRALVADRLVLSLENKQWLYEQGVLAEDKLRVNVQSWALALTVYPANPRSLAGGLFLQAGVGMANGRLTLLEPIEDDPWGNKFEEVFLEDERGMAYSVSAGFEVRVIRTAAIALSVSWVHQNFNGDIFDNASSIPFDLTLNWYW
jgi:hypothetical protein